MTIVPGVNLVRPQKVPISGVLTLMAFVEFGGDEWAERVINYYTQHKQKVGTLGYHFTNGKNVTNELEIEYCWKINDWNNKKNNSGNNSNYNNKNKNTNNMNSNNHTHNSNKMNNSGNYNNNHNNHNSNHIDHSQVNNINNNSNSNEDNYSNFNRIHNTNINGSHNRIMNNNTRINGSGSVPNLNGGGGYVGGNVNGGGGGFVGGIGGGGEAMNGVIEEITAIKHERATFLTTINALEDELKRRVPDLFVSEFELNALRREDYELQERIKVWF